jgi:hypothetical protein
MHSMRSALAAILFVASCANSVRADEGPHGPSIVGIDHIPTAVAQLEQAARDYGKLGFALKRGRPHENGLRNNHVKFEDGAGIELISPPAAPTDALSTHYARFLKEGEGPAYFAFHARDTTALHTALRSAGFKFKSGEYGTSLDEPLLDFLFFVQDNRSPTDLPEHFAHANSSTAMTGVWLALDDARHARLRKLLLALGAKETRERVPVPDPIEAEVFAVQNGRVVVLPYGTQIHAGRPVVGAEFQVRKLSSTACDTPTSKGIMVSVAKQCFVTSSLTHGLRLEFHERPAP